MAISFDETQISLQGVQGITISDIQPDTDSQQYIRVVQFFDVPPSSNNARPVLIVKMFGGDQTSGSRSELEVTTPTLEF